MIECTFGRSCISPLLNSVKNVFLADVKIALQFTKSIWLKSTLQAAYRQTLFTTD